MKQSHFVKTRVVDGCQAYFLIADGFLFAQDILIDLRPFSTRLQSIPKAGKFFSYGPISRKRH